jgi:hypothetical protein
MSLRISCGYLEAFGRSAHATSNEVGERAIRAEADPRPAGCFRLGQLSLARQRHAEQAVAGVLAAFVLPGRNRAMPSAPASAAVTSNASADR